MSEKKIKKHLCPKCENNQTYTPYVCPGCGVTYCTHITANIKCQKKVESNLKSYEKCVIIVKRRCPDSGCNWLITEFECPPFNHVIELQNKA
jgi:hypothetical protein